MTPLPRRAARRPATSRESGVNANRIKSGCDCACSAASASAAGSAMKSSNALSSLTWTTLAPCLPSAAAAALAPVPSATASTSPSSRAFAISSRAVDCSLPAFSSAYTHTFATELDNLRLGEDLQDAVYGGAIVFDDRARLARFSVGEALDRLSRLAALNSKLGEPQLFDLLRARRHDALQRRVSRLGNARRDRDQRGRRRLDYLVTIRGLAVDLQR